MGWEYVWHCHILSHEEMDMMRPVAVNVKRALPDAPGLTFDGTAGKLTWTDGTPVDYGSPISWLNPGTAEVGYRIERAPVTNGTVGAYASIGTALANATSFATTPPDSALSYAYRVIAWNAAGDTLSNVVTVAPALRATTTTVATNRTPASTVGQSVTFTARVAPTVGAGTASGTVQFAVDGTNVGAPVALASGRATYQTTTLTAGTHTVTATYSGSAAFAGSNGTVAKVVNKRTTTTNLRSSGTTAVFGQSLTFTAQVTAGAVGTVQFTVDNAAAGAAVTVNAQGRAILVLSTLAVGTHSVRAVYGGSPNDLGSSSAVLTQTVAKARSQAVVTSSRNPAPRNTEVTLTATLTPAAPGSGTPTGTVQFRIDNGTGTSVPLTGGQATITRTLGAGGHSVVAVYSGSADFLGATSPTFTQRMN